MGGGVLSWKATAYVKDLGRDRVTASEKLLLFVLADSHNEDRGYAFPSMPLLAEQSLRSKRQTERLLRSLEAKGLLTVRRQAVRGRANEYGFPGLNKGDMVSPLSAQKGGKMSPLRVTSGEAKDDKAVSPQPQCIQPPSQPQEKLTTTTAEALAGIVRALLSYGPADDQAANSLLRSCRLKRPDCEPVDVVHFIHAKGRGMGKRNKPIGFLLTAVPKCFEGVTWDEYAASLVSSAPALVLAPPVVDERLLDELPEDELEGLRGEQTAKLLKDYPKAAGWPPEERAQKVTLMILAALAELRRDSPVLKEPSHGPIPGALASCIGVLNGYPCIRGGLDREPGEPEALVLDI